MVLVATGQLLSSLGMQAPEYAGLSSCPVPMLGCSQAYGILAPQPGIEPTSTALEGRFLTTGPPGKSYPLFHLESKPKSFLRLSKQHLLCPPQKLHTCLMSYSSLPGSLLKPLGSFALTVPSVCNAPPLKYLSSNFLTSSRGTGLSSHL